MGKKWLILTCILSVLTFISSLISTILILNSEETKTNYISEEVLNSEDNNQIISITYLQNNALSLENITPGYSWIRKVKITNLGSEIANYQLVWDDIGTTWSDENQKEFIYSVTCTNGETAQETSMPTKREIMIEKMQIKPGQTNQCTITIALNKNEDNTEVIADNSFKGTFKIEIE